MPNSKKPHTIGELREGAFNQIESSVQFLITPQFLPDYNVISGVRDIFRKILPSFEVV
ncbi:hypothetical protein OROMI_028332 [Orobanche minor]